MLHCYSKVSVFVGHSQNVTPANNEPPVLINPNPKQVVYLTFNCYLNELQDSLHSYQKGPRTHRLKTYDLNSHSYFSESRQEESSSEEDPLCPRLENSTESAEYLYSPCHAKFDTRFVIGTHNARREEMEHFPSRHGNFRYVRNLLLIQWKLLNVIILANQSDYENRMII